MIQDLLCCDTSQLRFLFYLINIILHRDATMSLVRRGTYVDIPDEPSPMDKAYMLLLYPPFLPEGAARIKEALFVAGVPAETRNIILSQSTPEKVRKSFIQWNVQSRRERTRYYRVMGRFQRLCDYCRRIGR